MPTLLSQLQSKIESGVFSLGGLLSSNEATALEEAFQLVNPLSFSNITADDLKTTGSNVTLTVTDKFSLLNLGKITLTIESVFSGTSLDDLQVLVKVSLPANWQLSQSFPELTSIFPFSQFDIGTGTACFIYTTQAFDTSPVSPQIALSKGLNFYLKDLTGFDQGDDAWTGSLKALLPADLQTDFTTILQNMELFGSFEPAGDNPYPVIDLNAQVTNSTGGSATITLDVPLPTGETSSMTLVTPKVNFQITEPVKLIQNFILSIDTGLVSNSDPSDVLDISLMLSETPKVLHLVAKPPKVPAGGGTAPKTFSLSDVESLIPGASDFNQYVPSEVGTIFSEIFLDYFNLKLNLDSVGAGPTKTNALNSLYLGISAGTLSAPANWTIYDTLVVENVTLDLSKLNIGTTQVETAGLSAKARIFPTVFTGDFDFTIDLEKKTTASWEVNKISARYYGSVKLQDIVNAIEQAITGTNDTVSLPEAFSSLVFSDFYLVADEEDKKWSCGTHVDFTLTLDDVSFYSSIGLTFSEVQTGTGKSAKTTKSWGLTGQLVIGDDYTINYSYDSSSSTLTATATDSTTPLGFNTLLNALNFSEEIPANLDVDLTSVGFTYHFDTKEFDFTCTSQTYGTVSLVKNPSGIVVMFQSDFSLGSGQVPLFGPKLKGLVAFDNIGFMLATESGQASDFSTLTLPVTSFNKGIYLSADVKILGESQPVAGEIYQFDKPAPANATGDGNNDGGGGDQPDNGGGADASSTSAPGTAAASASASNAHTFTISIKKHLGPFYLDSLGFSFLNDDLNIIFNASVAMGPLTLGFDNLEIGSSLTHFSPYADLEGMSLDYHTDDFSIEGAFLHEDSEYSGMFTLSLTKFQLSAIGSYSANNGHPSLFLYGVLDEPLGGPAFMFVDGLALAFGYNRAFIPPPVADVATFPLITAAQSGPPSTSTANLATMLGKLDDYIPPKDGEYFVGLGIKFMSFKVINSFALLIGQFGKDLEFDLLGTSSYIAPHPGVTDPAASVELEIVGSYTPDTKYGELIVRGQLTPNSFVLSKKCHLQGGFAIAFWTKGSRGGDFIFSFGGYGSHFTPATYYPQDIPQLGFLWKVDSEVSIKGGGYWALDPKEIAAGGFLKALFQTSWVRASFDADAYFFIEWSPLHYQAGFTVTFSLSVKVDLLFFSVWLGFSLSEGLKLHGPPFGGAAGINLAVATVWIKFGASPGPPPLLTWAQFAQRFLPGGGGATDDKVVTLDIVSGLIKKVSSTTAPGGYVYFINPKDLHIVSGSFVPLTTLDTPANNNQTVDTFTVTPTGETFSDITTGNYSKHTITLSGADTSELGCTLADTKNAPTSMWSLQGTAKTARTSALHFNTDIQPVDPVAVGRTSSVDRSELVDSNLGPFPFEWTSLQAFGDTTDAASTYNDTPALSNNVFNDLTQYFNIADTSPTDYNGLANRLGSMNTTSIFTGSLG